MKDVRPKGVSENLRAGTERSRNLHGRDRRRRRRPHRGQPVCPSWRDDACDRTCDGTGDGEVEAQAARQEVVAETIKIVSTSVLGLTVGRLITGLGADNR